MCMHDDTRSFGFCMAGGGTRTRGSGTCASGREKLQAPSGDTKSVTRFDVSDSFPVQIPSSAEIVGRCK